jgi:hypothetical protein
LNISKHRGQFFFFLLILLVYLIINLSSCDNSPDENNQNGLIDQTKIQFINLEQYPVTIYSDPARSIVFAQVGALSQTLVSTNPTPLGVAFYPVFQIAFKIDTTEIIIPYETQTIIIPINEGKTNPATINKLKTIEINSSYILLRNNSTFSLSLREGNSEKNPISGRSTIIGSGLSAVYEINPGLYSNYTVMRNTIDPVSFPVGFSEFRQGVIYEFIYYNTGLVLVNETDVMDDDSIKWANDINGTLNIVNNTSYDMIIFIGYPIPFNNRIGNIIGGVRAKTSKNFNIASHLSDFQEGGWAEIYGISRSEYYDNIDNGLMMAKIKYSAWITYGQDRRFKTEITSISSGDYMYQIRNNTNLGIELRQNHLLGETIGYISRRTSRWTMYANSADLINIFPVYVYYNKSTRQVTSFVILNWEMTNFNNVYVLPGTNSQVQLYDFPPRDLTHFQIVTPAAYITVINNTNQSWEFNPAFSRSQNGYYIITSNENITFEILHNFDTMIMHANLQSPNLDINLPVLFEERMPTIIRGYDYVIEVTGSGTISGDFIVTFYENGVRDLSWLEIW